MKTKKILIYMLICSSFISACSRVNSMAPFDDQQAAIVASNIAGSSTTQRHQLPVKRKAEQGSNQNNNGS